MRLKKPPIDPQQELAQASATGDASACAWWMFLGARPEVPNANGWTPLVLAACKGRVGVMRNLLFNTDAASLDPQGETALMWAASSGRLQIVQMLAQCGGADIRCSKGHTALEKAIERKQIPCALALAPWTDLLAMDELDRTPLLLAASLGDMALVQALLTGSDPSHVGSDHLDAMAHAKIAGHDECSALIEAEILRRQSPEATSHMGSSKRI